MIILVYKVENFFGDEIKYATHKQFASNRESGMYVPLEIEIPERFHPVAELGTTRKDDKITVDCNGVRYPLEEVLGADGWGRPALVWKDAKYGFFYRVSLKEV